MTSKTVTIHAISPVNLDFDDSCQYALVSKHNLTLVSFDTDFDKTERGRKTPADFLR